MESTRTEFIETITAQFEQWCKQTENEPSHSLFAQYILNRSLICDKTVKRFLVIEKYPKLLEENKNIKRSAIWDLEEIVDLKERQIFSILDKYSVHYRLQNRLIAKSCK